MTTSHARITRRARAYAVEMHGDQKYGTHPYVHHLDAVVALLQPYGSEGASHRLPARRGRGHRGHGLEVQERFGDLVARCVALLTDAPGATRKERKAKTYAALAQVTGDEELALVVKAADRLANVRACVADGHRRAVGHYQGEQATFRSAAFRAGQCDPLWAELGTLLSPERAPA
jgi:(p)ppGpp synthase/HD superfamily hydrolase